MDPLEPTAIVLEAKGTYWCRHCERILRPLGDQRYVCPCCGELNVLIDRLFGNDGPDSDGMVRSGMSVNRAGHATELPATHLCPPAKKRRERPPHPSLFDQVPDGR